MTQLKQMLTLHKKNRTPSRPSLFVFYFQNKLLPLVMAMYIKDNIQLISYIFYFIIKNKTNIFTSIIKILLVSVPFLMLHKNIKFCGRVKSGELMNLLFIIY
mgnify:CR=1 FL=1